MNAAEQLARAASAAAQLADDIETNMQHGKSIVLHLLSRARNDAVNAMLALPDADANNPKQILNLQNDVQRFLLLGEWLREAVIAGEEAMQIIETEDRGELIQIIHETIEAAPAGYQE